jgi:hypothetical protein
LIDPASSPVQLTCLHLEIASSYHEDNCAAMLDVAGFECTWRVRRYFCLTESVWQMLCWFIWQICFERKYCTMYNRFVLRKKY